MPSLSLLRRGSKSQNAPSKDGRRGDVGTTSEPPTVPPALGSSASTAAARPQTSPSRHDRSKSDGERLFKRDLFHGLLGRTRTRAGSAPNKQQQQQQQTAASQWQRGSAEATASGQTTVTSGARPLAKPLTVGTSGSTTTAGGVVSDPFSLPTTSTCTPT
jgi:hypothetical protein